MLTLIVLPIFLSFGNSVKTTVKWLYYNRKITKEEVERVVRVKRHEEQVEAQKQAALVAQETAVATQNELNENEANVH